MLSEPLVRYVFREHPISGLREHVLQERRVFLENGEARHTEWHDVPVYTEAEIKDQGSLAVEETDEAAA